MRHWKFTTMDEIEPESVLAYMKEAIDNQRKGKVWTPDKIKVVKVPQLLKSKLEQDSSLANAFEQLSPYKRREFCEYIASAKQEATKMKRLEKIVPMILDGISLNDRYRKG